jgi:hypothetical protein
MRRAAGSSREGEEEGGGTEAESIVVYITADNHQASLQMRDLLYPYAADYNISLLLSSKRSCHINFQYIGLDKFQHNGFHNSKDCFAFTAVSWAILSLSEVIIGQGFGVVLELQEEVNTHERTSRYIHAPVSSFPKTAAIYGLFPESPFRTAPACSQAEPVTLINQFLRLPHASWLC